VGSEGLQGAHGVFERPAGVAGVEVDADEIRSGFLDECLQLARLHVAGMVLDGDPHAGIDRP